MKSKGQQNNKIESLQALRTLAFLGIFFSQAGFFIKWSSLGVSIFFVLSGFLMYCAYEKTLDNTLKANFIFSLNKIQKIISTAYYYNAIFNCFKHCTYNIQRNY